MRKIFCLLVFVTLAASASAQITWNAKGGLGLANCHGDADTKSVFVAKAGVGIEKPLSADWSLMPSLELAWKGAQEKNWDNRIDLLYLQIPVVAAYRLNLSDSWNMTLKAGPYFAYNVYAKDSDGQGDLENKYDAGLDVGIDFEYHKFVFGLEYEYGLVSMFKDVSIKTSAFYATVGWKF